MKSSRVVVIVVAVLAATLAVSGPSADAAKAPIVFKTKSVKVRPGVSRATVKMKCPRKYQVVNGGGQITGGLRGGSIMSSAPFDDRDKKKVPDDGWRVAANNTSGLSATLRGWATCVRSRTHHYEISTLAVTDGSTLTLDDDCDVPGQEVMGGGFAVPGSSPEIDLSSNSPNDINTWRGQIWNGSGTTLIVTIVTICTSENLSTHSFTTVQHVAGTQEQRTVFCPGASSALIGGGVITASGTGNANLMASVPVRGPDPNVVTDDGWTAIGSNLSSVNRTFTTAVICR